MDTDQSSNVLSSIQSEVAKYQMLIEEENQKLKRYKVCSLCFSDETIRKVVRKSQLYYLWETVAINWMRSRKTMLCKFMLHT